MSTLKKEVPPSALRQSVERRPLRGWKMATPLQNEQYPDLRADMPVVGDDNEQVGTILEVFRDIGLVETFGAKGIPPQQEGHDPVEYAYSEAMPGAGDDYVTVRGGGGEVLYIPFAALSRVENGRAVLAVDADSVPLMNWEVRPDALKSVAHEYESDSGAESNVA
jgi:hypothetical protein